MSEDIRYRQNRYLLMMGIRLVCFIAALLMFVNHLGWLAAIPAVGAIIIPYIATESLKGPSDSFRKPTLGELPHGSAQA